MSYIIKMALDIKAGFEPPAPMTSSLEAYCAAGTIAKAMKLGVPEKKNTLFEMHDQLDGDIGSSEPEDNRIARIHAILKNFIRNEDTTDQMIEYVTYGYENEKWQNRSQSAGIMELKRMHRPERWIIG